MVSRGESPSRGDLSRIRFADPAAFGHRHGRIPGTLMNHIDHGLRRLLAL